MTKCPQCGYERTNNDDKFISAEECPKCGIFYEKWHPSYDPGNKDFVIKHGEELNVNKGNKSILYTSIIVCCIIFILLAILGKFTFFTKKDPTKQVEIADRIISSLPVVAPLGVESNSYIIRVSGNEQSITAAGQIFSPPHQTPDLFKLGFLFTQYSLNDSISGIRLQVILSEWNGDRPGPAALWVSEPTTIPNAHNNFQADWVDFDIPHLTLNHEKQYIAWVILSGLENHPDASIGIPGMGPRYSRPPSYCERKYGYASSPYPQGMRAFYKQENPDGGVSQMNNSPWEVHDLGHNLHFRMSFEGLSNAIKNKTSEIQDSRKEMMQKQEQQRAECETQQIQIEQQQAQEREQERVQRQQEIEQEIEQRRVEREIQQYKSEQRREQQRIEREIQQYEYEQQQKEIQKQGKIGDSMEIRRRGYRRR